jgi:hypothetical protein
MGIVKMPIKYFTSYYLKLLVYENLSIAIIVVGRLY